MTRSLTKSNLHYKHALKQLPLGVSSNFRAWGEEKTIFGKILDGEIPSKN